MLVANSFLPSVHIIRFQALCQGNSASEENSSLGEGLERELASAAPFNIMVNNNNNNNNNNNPGGR